jgi:hypothetical protein
VAKVRAKTDAANPPAAGSGSADEDVNDVISAFVDQHHDF